MNASLVVFQGHITLSPDLVRFFGLEAQAKAQAIRETESEAEEVNRLFMADRSRQEEEGTTEAGRKLDLRLLLHADSYMGRMRDGARPAKRQKAKPQARAGKSATKSRSL